MLNSLRTDSKQVLEQINSAIASIDDSMEQFRFREAQNTFMDIARIGNKYLTENEPWRKIKEDESHTSETLVVSAQIMAKLAIVSEPFLPFTSNKLKELLQINLNEWSMSLQDVLLPSGHVLNEPTFLFEKIEDDLIEKQIEKLRSTAAQNKESVPYTPEALKEYITFEDFLSMDMRVSTILEAEKMPKTKKLMKLLVDTGLDKRTIISGIADQYEPEALIGKQVLVLVNLSPRDMKGVTSQGMILLAEDGEGKLTFVVPEQSTQNGSTVK